MTPEQFYALLGVLATAAGAVFWLGSRYGGLKAGQDQHTKQIEGALAILTDQTKTILTQAQTLTALTGDFSRFHNDYESARYRDRFAHVEGLMNTQMAGVSNTLARLEALLIAGHQQGGHGQGGHGGNSVHQQ